MKVKKKFDCVQMKRDAQRRLRAEYESRKGEFSSYAEFIAATANQSPEIREFKAKIRHPKPAPTP